MSTGEGLDEAAKDAADIAAFFKSGKSERGESDFGRATVELPVWSATLLPKGTKASEGIRGRGYVLRFWTCWRDAHSL